MGNMMSYTAQFASLGRNIVQVTRCSYKSQKGYFFGRIATTLVIACLPYLMIWLTAGVINADRKQGARVIMFVAAYSLLSKVVYPANSFVYIRLHRRLNMFFELLKLRILSGIGIATYEDPEFHNLLVKANRSGTFAYIDLLNQQLENFKHLISIMLGMYMFIQFSAWACLVVFTGYLVSLIPGIRSGKASYDLYDDHVADSRKYLHLAALLSETDKKAELCQYQNEDPFLEKASGLYGGFVKKQEELDCKIFLWECAAGLAGVAAEISVLLWVLFEINEGHVKPGMLLTVWGSMGQFQIAVGGFLGSLRKQFETNFDVENNLKLIKIKPVLGASSRPVMLKKGAPPLIQFENVSFAYPGKHRLILDGINFTIEPGTSVALVGPNGCGKTTLLALLARWYDPACGRILVNGHDLRDIDPASWRSLMGYVIQKSTVYKFSVAESIAVGRSDEPLNHERVRNAAHAAGLHDLITAKLSGGYDHMIGADFGGFNPSGGEAQKFAIARVMYRQPDIYIFDEATRAIDAQSEYEISEQIERHTKGKTVIYTSHDFARVRKADLIYVLEGGKISEFGTHQELIAENKTYAQLFEIQAAGYRN